MLKTSGLGRPLGIFTMHEVHKSQSGQSSKVSTPADLRVMEWSITLRPLTVEKITDIVVSRFVSAIVRPSVSTIVYYL